MKCDTEKLQQIAQDATFHDLGVLPSQGIPYLDMATFYIRPFKLAEYKMLSVAAQLGEMSHLLRAVDNVISYPVERLTIGDFYYVMLWLRLKSMPKSPYITEWKCHQPYFVHKETKQPLLYSQDKWPTVEQLQEQYDASECNTENTSVLHDTDTRILSLDENFSLPEGFDFPRMNIYEDRAAALADPEMAYIAPAVQWIAGNTWAEKLAAAEANPNLIGEALDINRKTIHGIDEEVTFFCNRCRVEHTTKLKLNALSFFQ